MVSTGMRSTHDPSALWDGTPAQDPSGLGSFEKGAFESMADDTLHSATPIVDPRNTGAAAPPMRNHQLAPVLLRLPPRRLYHQPVQIHPRGQIRHLDPHNPPRNDTCPPRPGFGYGALTRNASGNALTTSCAVNAPRSNVIRYDLPHTSARPSTHR